MFIYFCTMFQDDSATDSIIDDLFSRMRSPPPPVSFVPSEPSRKAMDRFRAQNSQLLVSEGDLRTFLVACGEPCSTDEFIAEAVQDHNAKCLDVTTFPPFDITACIREEVDRQLAVKFAAFKAEFAAAHPRVELDTPSPELELEPVAASPELELELDTPSPEEELNAALDAMLAGTKRSTPSDDDDSAVVPKKKKTSVTIPSFDNQCSGKAIFAMMYLTGGVTFMANGTELVVGKCPNLLSASDDVLDRHLIARAAKDAPTYCLAHFLRNLREIMADVKCLTVPNYAPKDRLCYVPVPALEELRALMDAGVEITAYVSNRTKSTLRHTSFPCNAYSSSIFAPVTEIQFKPIRQRIRKKQNPHIPAAVMRIHSNSAGKLSVLQRVTTDMATLFDYIEAGIPEATFKPLQGLPVAC